MLRNQFEINDLYRGSANTDSLFWYFYVHYYQLKNDMTSDEVIKNESVKIIKTVIENNASDYQKVFEKVQDRIDEEQLKSVIINYGEGHLPRNLEVFASSKNLTGFIPELFEINSESKIADFGSGLGMSSLKMAKHSPEELVAIDLNPEIAAINEARLKIYSECNTIDYKVLNEDLFVYSLDNPNEKFDYIFSDFPWGMRNNETSDKWASKLFEGIKFSRQLEWKFIALVMSHLKEDGKAIVFAPFPIEHRNLDKPIRQEFIEKGYIEKIIEFPNHTLHTTSIPFMMLVLSFGNDEIEFIDASNMFTEKGRLRYFTEENIQTILSKNFSNKMVINKKEVLERERLIPSYYGIRVIDDGVELQEVAEGIRGKNYTRKELDGLLVEKEPTNYELIRSSHLSNSFVNNSDYLSDFPENYEILEDLDILITRVGSSRNIGIYRKIDGIESIADQSIIIIRVNHEKINPYFLFSYFLSDLGKEQLSTAYSSGGISQLSLKNLNKVSVPNVSAKERDTIADIIENKMEEISNLELRLEIEKEELQEQINQTF